MTRQGPNGRALRLVAAAAAAIALAGAFALVASGRIAERTATVTVPPDSIDASAEARCPKGKKVVLGGFEAPVESGRMVPTHLKREGKRRWLAGSTNTSSETRSLTSIAYCGQLKGIKARTATVTVPAQGIEDPPVTVEAKCRRKERLAFGGFDSTISEDTEAYLSDLRRVGKRRWLVGAFNFSNTVPLTAIAYCSKKAPKTSTESETVTLGPDDAGNATARCGRGERLAFGGFTAEVKGVGAFVLVRGLARTTPREWQVSAIEDNSAIPGQLTAYAYCAEK